MRSVTGCGSCGPGETGRVSAAAEEPEALHPERRGPAYLDLERE